MVSFLTGLVGLVSAHSLSLTIGAVVGVPAELAVVPWLTKGQRVLRVTRTLRRFLRRRGESLQPADHEFARKEAGA